MRSIESPEDGAAKSLEVMMMSQGGTCMICEGKTSRQAMGRHLQKCLAEEGEGPQAALMLRVDSPGLRDYWLDIEVAAHAPLARIDRFLRSIWLECCGHLSEFEVGTARYISSLDPDVRSPKEKTMAVRCDRALEKWEGPFFYEYDFGSTTRLRLKVTGRRFRKSGFDEVRLLARNQEPERSCAVCGGPAVSVCAACFERRFVCRKHERKHGVCVEDFWSRLKNSPRTGVCGY